MDRLRIPGAPLLTIGVCLLSGCSSSQVLLAHRIPLVAVDEAVDDRQLLDVGIVVFDPGVPAGNVEKDDLDELHEDGVFVHIRRAESVQMAVQLRDTLQRSGHWGAVWITPEESMAADVNVTAEIVQSDGYIVRVEAKAVDLAGSTWLDEHYELETAAAAYAGERYGGLDPYQDLFNSIANDLAAARAAFQVHEVRELKTIGTLRYAADLSPDAFDGYLAERHDGSWTPVRLPSRDDPMFERTRGVRMRERLFLETLDLYYENLALEAQESYDGWRESSREQSLEIRDLTRGARLRTGLGIVAMIGSVLYGGDLAFAGSGMMSIGAELLNMGAETAHTRNLYSAELVELSSNYDDEIAPIVVELAGVEHRLTGTAEAQYAELRELLRQLFVHETGLAPEVTEAIHEGGAGKAVID